MRAGFYIRRRPQYHPALDPPPSYTAAQLHPAAGFGRGFRGLRAGFYIRRWIRRPAIPPPSYIRRRVSGGFHRGRAVEGGFRGLKLGRRNSWGGFLPRRGG